MQEFLGRDVATFMNGETPGNCAVTVSKSLKVKARCQK